MGSESKIVNQLKKSVLTRPNSILDRFSTGNLETLKVRALMDHLKSFYSEQYSSDRMTLTMVSSLPLD